MAEKHEMQGFCHYCKSFFDAVPVTEEQAEIIAEDAQDPADYYTLVDHLDPKTGQHCDGSGSTPESPFDPDGDKGNYLEMGDIPSEELGDEEPIRRLSDEEKKFDANENEVALYGHRAHD